MHSINGTASLVDYKFRATRKSFGSDFHFRNRAADYLGTLLD